MSGDDCLFDLRLQKYLKRVLHTLPGYSPTLSPPPAQNGKLKLRVPMPSQASTKVILPPNGTASLQVKHSPFTVMFKPWYYMRFIKVVDLSRHVMVHYITILLFEERSPAPTVSSLSRFEFTCSCGIKVRL